MYFNCLFISSWRRAYDYVCRKSFVVHLLISFFTHINLLAASQRTFQTSLYEHNSIPFLRRMLYRNDIIILPYIIKAQAPDIPSSFFSVPTAPTPPPRFPHQPTTLPPLTLSIPRHFLSRHFSRQRSIESTFSIHILTCRSSRFYLDCSGIGCLVINFLPLGTIKSKRNTHGHHHLDLFCG